MPDSLARRVALAGRSIVSVTGIDAKPPERIKAFL
jgi:hypothetical protein